MRWDHWVDKGGQMRWDHWVDKGGQMRWDHWVDKEGLRGGTIGWIRGDCEVGPLGR